MIKEMLEWEQGFGMYQYTELERMIYYLHIKKLHHDLVTNETLTPQEIVRRFLNNPMSSHKEFLPITKEDIEPYFMVQMETADDDIDRQVEDSVLIINSITTMVKKIDEE